MKKLQFNQIKSQNFYVAHTHNGGEILKSYNTIVGYITPYGALYRVRYTHTTGKQITQYYNNNFAFVEENFCTADELAETIKAHENANINTQYNGVYGDLLFID